MKIIFADITNTEDNLVNINIETVGESYKFFMSQKEWITFREKISNHLSIEDEEIFLKNMQQEAS